MKNKCQKYVLRLDLHVSSNFLQKGGLMHLQKVSTQVRLHECRTFFPRTYCPGRFCQDVLATDVLANKRFKVDRFDEILFLIVWAYKPVYTHCRKRRNCLS